MSVPVAVLASGGGSNLQALLDSSTGDDAFHICVVISDRAEAGALERARARGVPAVHVPVRGRPELDVAEETLAALASADAGFVVLAGYLRLVPVAVIRAFAGRIINIHPALLPAFGGRGMYGTHVHRAVLEAGCRVTGVTVHRVTEAYDEGGILAQWPVPVLTGDTPESLARRVLAIEHVLLPAVTRALVHGSRLAAGPPDGDYTAFRLRSGGHDQAQPDAAELLRLADLGS